MSTDNQPDLRIDDYQRPETIGALASRVISVLSDRQGIDTVGVRTFVLDHLYRAVLARGAFDANDMMEQLRGHRLSCDAVIDLYVPQAAARLGRDWMSDRISFADVTIGALRLQALLGDATARVEFDMGPEQGQLRAMVIVPRGEQHFLGASVLTAQLRRMGCTVVMSFDDSLGMLGAKLPAENPDLVLITCGGDETVESVAKTVQTIRNACRTAPPILLGGAIASGNNDLIERTGVDKVTCRADEALAYVAKHAACAERT